MNGVAEEPVVQTSYRSTKPKKVTAPKATESQSKATTALPGKPASTVEELSSGSSSPDTSTLCNGTADKAADSAADSTSKCGPSVDSAGDGTGAGVTSSSVANVVFLSPCATTVAKSVDPPKNSKLYMLNGNVLKEVNDVDKVKGDKVNYVRVSASNLGTVIKKIQSENAVLHNGKPSAGCGEADGDKPKPPSTVPTFFQLSHPSLLKANGNPKIAFSVSPSIVTKPSTTSYDILRSKLLENSTAGLLAAKAGERAASTAKSADCDSPAVARARSELVRSRKALIEAAIYPQLPTYAPPAYYSGPTYSCEECEDTFTSLDGLSNHKNRRSVLFTYACPVCKKTLEFYSRCMFLLHVRSHDAAVKACFLNISIIPANKLNFAVLNGEAQRCEVESVPLCDLTVADPGSSAGDKSASPASSHSQQAAPLYRRRKTSSPDDDADDRSFDVDDEPVCIDRLEISGSSSDDVAIVDAAESPAHADSVDETVAGRGAKVRRKRASNVRPNAASKSATADRSTTYSTTNSTATTTTLSYGDRVDHSASRTPGRGAAPAHPKARSQIACGAGATAIDEIHLTSSDEEEPAPPEEPKNLRIPCRECHEEVASLTSHYRAANRPLREYPCDQCKFFNPSACALAAHVRMHTRSLPHICPDCGFYFSTTESFLVHVKQVCFYDYKAIRFRCPDCSQLKPSVPLFLDHLKRCHIREVFKCSVCITSSYSKHIVQAHMERVHPQAKPNVLEGYRCMLCPNVLVAKQSIDVHVKKHVFGLQHLRYVYICKFCRNYATGRMSKFEAHYHSCAERPRDSPPCARAAKRTAGPAVRKSPEKRAPPAEKDPLSMEDWEADQLKAEYVPKTKWCVMCRTTKLSEHSKSLFCNACVSYVNAADGSGASPADGPAEGADKAEGVAGSRSKRKLKCKLCKQLLNRDWSTITNHYLQDHHADFDVGAAASKSKAQESATAVFTTRKRKSSALKQEPASATSTPIVGSSSGAGSAPASASTSAVEPAPAKASKVECKYRCVKCGFSADVRNDFHEHIVSHKTQSNANYQCLECGECFIVKPSLKKHLIVVHKVRDIGEYDKDNRMVNGGGSDDDADDESKAKTVAENQCEVCYMQCDSKQQYDRHIRTHGMAFVAMQSRAKS